MMFGGDVWTRAPTLTVGLQRRSSMPSLASPPDRESPRSRRQRRGRLRPPGPLAPRRSGLRPRARPAAPPPRRPRRNCPDLPPECCGAPVQVVADRLGFEHQAIVGLAVLLPDVGPQPADDHHRVSLADAARHVLGKGAETAHLDPGGVSVPPLALGPHPRRTREPELRDRPVRLGLYLGAGIAGDVYDGLHGLVLSLVDDVVGIRMRT